MPKTTVLPLTVTVANPPVQIDLTSIGSRNAVQPVSVSTQGETFFIFLRAIE